MVSGNKIPFPIWISARSSFGVNRCLLDVFFNKATHGFSKIVVWLYIHIEKEKERCDKFCNLGFIHPFVKFSHWFRWHIILKILFAKARQACIYHQKTRRQAHICSRPVRFLNNTKPRIFLWVIYKINWPIFLVFFFFSFLSFWLKSVYRSIIWYMWIEGYVNIEQCRTVTDEAPVRPYIYIYT